MTTLAGHETVPAPPAAQEPRFKRILCPLDFSDLATLAMERATRLAGGGGAEILGLFVSPVSNADGGARATVAADAGRFFEPAREAGLKVHLSQVAGDPAAEILSTACGWPADLIVMGTHGRTGLDRWILGSVAQTVLRHAPCPVLTVGGGRRDAHAAVARDGGSVLCALELNGTSPRTLAHALALARLMDRNLTLVHVLENMSQYQAAALCSRVDWPALCRDVERDAHERLLRMAEASGGMALVGEVRVVPGKPYREVLRLAEERDAAAIVMGIHGRASLQMRLFGSNAEHVVREAGCPVLTVREA